MKQSIGIVVPHYNTPIWTQTALWGLVSSLDSYKDKYDLQVLLVDNTSSPEESPFRSLKRDLINSIKLVPELADQIEIIKNPHKSKGHGIALDIAVQHFDTDFLLCWETDIVIHKDNWLDWIMLHMKDPKTWMAGFEIMDSKYTKYPSTYWYVMPNPGIYRMDILKGMATEVLGNTDPTFYYGENFIKTIQIPDALPYPGPFSERRGFKDTHPDSPDGKGGMARRIPRWYENGQWLFYRMMRDSRKLNYSSLNTEPALWIDYNGMMAPRYADFNNGTFRHHFCGSRSWDFMTHEERNTSQINYVRPKIEEEIRIWKEKVPERIRKIVPEVFNSCRNDEYEYNNLKCIYSQPNTTPREKKLSLDTAEWYKREFLDTDFMNLLK